MSDSEYNKYMQHAEWASLDDLISEWCDGNKYSDLFEPRKLATLGACSRSDVFYTRTDGKSFDDPVIDLYGRGILLIDKETFYSWRSKIETPPVKSQKFSGFKAVLDSEDDDYMSLNDLIMNIRQHVDGNTDEAVRVIVALVRGRQNLPCPKIYRKERVVSWRNVESSSYLGLPFDSFVHLLEKAAKQITDKENFDDLPF